MREMVERETRMDDAEQTIRELVEALDAFGEVGADGIWHDFLCPVLERLKGLSEGVPLPCHVWCENARAALERAKS